MDRITARRHAAALAAVLGCLALALVFVPRPGRGHAAGPQRLRQLRPAGRKLAGRAHDHRGRRKLPLAGAGDLRRAVLPVLPAGAGRAAAAAGGAGRRGAGGAQQPCVRSVRLLAAAGVYGCFWRRGAAPAAAAYFAVFCAAGSNLFWLMTSGGVWFLRRSWGSAWPCGACSGRWGRAPGSRRWRRCAWPRRSAAARFMRCRWLCGAFCFCGAHGGRGQRRLLWALAPAALVARR